MILRKRGCKIAAVLLAVVMLAVGVGLINQAMSATANPSTASTGYEQILLHVQGPITSTTTPIVWKSPWPYRVLSVTAYARTLTAGDSTYTVDLKQGVSGTSLLTSAISIATTEGATLKTGTLATTPTIPDEATVGLILTLGGSTPSISDLTVHMAVKRQ